LVGFALKAGRKIDDFLIIHASAGPPSYRAIRPCTVICCETARAGRHVPEEEFAKFEAQIEADVRTAAPDLRLVAV